MEPEKSESWKMCCSNSSATFIKFTITAIFCFSIMIFCMIMIVSNPDRDNSIYFSLISSILSLYIPSPTLHDDKVQPKIEQPMKEIEKEKV